MRRAHPTTILMGGLLGGLTVGVCDGLNAGLRADVAQRRLPEVTALAAGVDMIVGLLVALTVIVVMRGARWGRRRRVSAPTQRVALAALGLALTMAVGALLSATTAHPDRFAAALLVAGAAGVLGVVAALLAPALGRVLAPRVRDEAETVVAFVPRIAPAGLLLIAPLAGGALLALLFFVVSQTPTPTGGVWRTTWVVGCGLLVAPLPLVLVTAAQLGHRIPRLAALVVALALACALVVIFFVATWAVHLRHLPWRDLRVMAAIVVVGAVVTLWLHRRRVTRTAPTSLGAVPPRSRAGAWAVVLLVPPLGVAGAVGAGGSEAARRAMAAQGGLVDHALALARRAFDRDGDGHASRLGGDDCNDRDPNVHALAIDRPGDGIDQDCDGGDLGAAAPTPAASDPVPEGVPQALNVLMVVVSGLRPDHVGRGSTPVLDRLVAEGVMFENAWAHAPGAVRAMASLVTGRWPSAIDWTGADRFSRSQPTLAELMRAQGYVTAGFYADARFDRGAAPGFERGMVVHDDRRVRLHRRAPGADAAPGSSAQALADDVRDFLRLYAEGGWKLFVTLHFVDPRPPHERPYAEEVRATDEQLGRVLAQLQSLGLYDKTAIVVTADQAAPPGEGADLSAQRLRVPLIWRVPGLSPRRLTGAVGHVDVAPTVLNLVRAPMAPTFLGRSLVAVMAGAADVAVLPVLQETDGGWGVATGSHHVVWERRREHRFRCHDLRRDPEERRDIWAMRTGEGVCEPLASELRRRLPTAALARPAPAFTLQHTSATNARETPPVKPQHPCAVRFAEFAQLVGVDLSRPDDPRRVRLRAGERLDLTVHFEITRALPGWQLFLGIDGQAPVGVPVDHWRAHQKTRDGFSLTVHPRQPPGSYPVHLWFSRPPAFADRLPISPRDAQDGRDRLTVATITVE